MLKFFALVLLVAIVGNCQLIRDDERPTRYVLPYSGLGAGEESDVAEEKYYKPNRRAERIPATAYQYDDEEDYYRPQPPPQPQPQPQPRQKVETDNYRYQQTTPSHKDYEDILKHNHLARLRVAAKKQTQPALSQHPQLSQLPQTPVEQYLKEVNPTTKTAYQRPQNYLRYSAQSLKPEPSEETPLKPQQYRYVLQPELQQQKPFQQYQFETQPEPAKQTPKPTPHFNLVAYQNALIAQQKLLAAESQDDGTSKSAIYISQSVKKAKKPKTTPPRPATTQQYEYYPQVPPQRPTYSPEAAANRYQQPLTPRNLFPKQENYQVEDSLLYPEPKELEYQTQAPVRPPKQRTTRLPRRKPKYQTEEPQDEYQPPAPKYQAEEPSYDYPPTLKYQDEPAYRRPLPPRPTKPAKYEEQTEAKDDYLYQPLPKYQRESLPPPPPPRRPPPPPQYSSEPEVRPSRYLSRQQYQEETKQLPQYHPVDLAYQSSAEVPVRQSGRGPSVSYRQTYPQYQYDRRQLFLTPVQPKTRHFNSVEYQNALIAEQEEEPTIYITNKPPSHFKTQKMYPSTQYKYHTASQRETNTIKLAPVSYQPPERSYEVVEDVIEEIEPEEAATYNAPVIKYQQVIEEPTETTKLPKFRPENVIKKKGLHYPRRQTKKPTYLNGQSFSEEVKTPRRYRLEDLVTQSSSNAAVRYDSNNNPFLILVYDE